MENLTTTPKNHQIKKAPIKRLLEQSTIIDKDASYRVNFNVYLDAVELVKNYLEETIQQIAQISTTRALHVKHRAYNNARRHPIRNTKNKKNNIKMS